MTTFETLCAIAEQTLRARGEWHGGATAYADMDRAANGAADLLRGDDMPDLISLALINMAISELKRRSGIHAHVWRQTSTALVDKCDICGELRA